MKKWKCSVCGYIHTGDEPPEKCPVCGADRSLFVELEPEIPTEPAGSQPSDANKGTSDKWKCTVCGYTHKGEAPPEQCPVCSADQVHYQPVTPDAKASTRAEESEDKEGEKEPIPDTSTNAEPPSDTGFTPYYDMITGKLTVLHAHPISVHIPNGVLPVSVLFIMISALFGIDALTTAAYCNMVFVTLSMPAVLFTGYNDWQRRYGGHMTSVFRTKILCGCVVSALALILSLWWSFDGEILTHAGSGRSFFILLCLVMLAAAVLAGYMGGKLVFPQNGE